MADPARLAAAPRVSQRCIQQAILRLQALPAFYPTVQEALELADTPLSHDGQIARVIASDPGLAARVLRLANSASFSFRGEVGTISQAIAIIGRDKILTLLRRSLAGELLNLLPARGPAAAEIRRLSLGTAAGAYLLAQRLRRRDKEELLLAGLMHNIGAPRTAGRWLVEAWHFPIFFAAIIEHYADPWAANFPAAPVSAITIVHLARKLAEAAQPEPPEWIVRQPETVLAMLPPLIFTTLEVDQEFIAGAIAELPAEIERAAAALV